MAACISPGGVKVDTDFNGGKSSQESRKKKGLKKAQSLVMLPKPPK